MTDLKKFAKCSVWNANHYFRNIYCKKHSEWMDLIMEK